MFDEPINVKNFATEQNFAEEDSGTLDSAYVKLEPLNRRAVEAALTSHGRNSIRVNIERTNIITPPRPVSPPTKTAPRPVLPQIPRR